MWEYRKRLAKNLKKYRGEMTEREFSKKVGIAQATLNRYLNCTQAASLDKLEIIAHRLKIEVSALIAKEEKN